MQDITQMTRGILAREGGFVNDLDDPGGATNRGITIGTMRRLGVDLDGDGDTDIADLRHLTEEQAVDIYLQHYFYGPRIDQLPDCLQDSVFDMYVNAGGQAVKLLQRLLCQMGHVLAVDGAIGPKTAQAAQAASVISGAHLRDAYGIARRNYYYSLADQRPASRKYARRKDGGKGGWIRRAEAFISDRYHLSDADHLARVAAWG
ncbi:holin-associated N-acetylmuramidase [Donghicola tyrosinivorans]|uniref:Putative peptidoglycan binding protein n=1 Tax=Donghicola tyrosinivorans TaxID=1652492 RepID=A0A2T0X5K5_9RHOB|nr:holin-associated N-acetylmuramidase [Donghicola tyrosinivorans]PRY94154.1 putative peptidoglycan binding protein [Donghicola tyrosinivorans]